jgi:hypothetical protein
MKNSERSALDRAKSPFWFRAHWPRKVTICSPRRRVFPSSRTVAVAYRVDLSPVIGYAEVSLSRKAEGWKFGVVLRSRLSRRASERASFRDNCDLSLPWILIWSAIFRISGQTPATPETMRRSDAEFGKLRSLDTRVFPLGATYLRVLIHMYPINMHITSE